MILADLTFDDFNPLERQRIREMIRRYGGDSSLLPLADEELDGAMGLTVTEGGLRRPTMAGILLLGREEILRRHLPAHEAAFQVLEGTDVRVPLLPKNGCSFGVDDYPHLALLLHRAAELALSLPHQAAVIFVQKSNRNWQR